MNIMNIMNTMNTMNMIPNDRWPVLEGSSDTKWKSLTVLDCKILQD